MHYLFILIFILLGCNSDISFKKSDKILYFRFMDDLQNNGKMTFINGSLSEKRIKNNTIYYKVYHNEYPHKVEKYIKFKLKKIYWFDSNSRYFKTLEYKNNKSIICSHQFKQKNAFYMHIELCDNQIKRIIAFKKGDFKYQEYYVNNKKIKKEVNINGNLYTYNGKGKLINVCKECIYGDSIPVYNPGLVQNYPWK